MTVNDIASTVAEYLSTLPNGTAISTSDAITMIYGCDQLAGGNYRIADMEISFSEFFALNNAVHKIAKQKGLMLDTSGNAEIPTGLPFHIPYMVYQTGECLTEHSRHLIFSKGGRHTMTWFHLTKVVYSQEYGDPSLPKLAELVSATPDPQKDIILDYLGEHCIAGCPGIHYDAVNPKEVIGHGHLFADDKYFWTDYFANYVRKYNIPVPADFRTHILENYKSRKIRHAKHRLLKSIRVTNNPHPGYRYTICINQNGSVRYSNNLGSGNEMSFMIDPEDADYIVHPITESIFCYDDVPNGTPTVDGYYWEIEFFGQNGLVYKSEGWPGEPHWRYRNFQDFLKFVERETGTDLGSGCGK